MVVHSPPRAAHIADGVGEEELVTIELLETVELRIVVELRTEEL